MSESWVSGGDFKFKTPIRTGRLTLAQGIVRSPINTRRRTTLALGKHTGPQVVWSDEESPPTKTLTSASFYKSTTTTTTTRSSRATGGDESNKQVKDAIPTLTKTAARAHGRPKGSLNEKVAKKPMAASGKRQSIAAAKKSSSAKSRETPATVMSPGEGVQTKLSSVNAELQSKAQTVKRGLKGKMGSADSKSPRPKPKLSPVKAKSLRSTRRTSSVFHSQSEIVQSFYPSSTRSSRSRAESHSVEVRSSQVEVKALPSKIVIPSIQAVLLSTDEDPSPATTTSLSNTRSAVSSKTEVLSPSASNLPHAKVLSSSLPKAKSVSSTARSQSSPKKISSFYKSKSPLSNRSMSKSKTPPLPTRTKTPKGRPRKVVKPNPSPSLSLAELGKSVSEKHDTKVSDIKFSPSKGKMSNKAKLAPGLQSPSCLSTPGTDQMMATKAEQSGKKSKRKAHIVLEVKTPRISRKHASVVRTVSPVDKMSDHIDEMLAVRPTHSPQATKGTPAKKSRKSVSSKTAVSGKKSGTGQKRSKAETTPGRRKSTNVKTAPKTDSAREDSLITSTKVAIGSSQESSSPSKGKKSNKAKLAPGLQSSSCLSTPGTDQMMATKVEQSAKKSNRKAHIVLEVKTPGISRKHASVVRTVSPVDKMSDHNDEILAVRSTHSPRATKGTPAKKSRKSVSSKITVSGKKSETGHKRSKAETTPSRRKSTNVKTASKADSTREDSLITSTKVAIESSQESSSPSKGKKSNKAKLAPGLQSPSCLSTPGADQMMATKAEQSAKKSKGKAHIFLEVKTPGTSRKHSSVVRTVSPVDKMSDYIDEILAVRPSHSPQATKGTPAKKSRKSVSSKTTVSGKKSGTGQKRSKAETTPSRRKSTNVKTTPKTDSAREDSLITSTKVAIASSQESGSLLIADRSSRKTPTRGRRSAPNPAAIAEMIEQLEADKKTPNKGGRRKSTSGIVKEKVVMQTTSVSRKRASVAKSATLAAKVPKYDSSQTKKVIRKSTPNRLSTVSKTSRKFASVENKDYAMGDNSMVYLTPDSPSRTRRAGHTPFHTPLAVGITRSVTRKAAKLEETLLSSPDASVVSESGDQLEQLGEVTSAAKSWCSIM